MIADQQMEEYLFSLRVHLGPISLSEREEIVHEIEAHIRDARKEEHRDLNEVLSRLGTAEQLAAQYRDGMLIRNASRSYSPVLLLRGALRLATRGVSGIVVFFAGMFGYLIGGGMVLDAMLKPVFPRNTGLWVDNGRLDSFGTVFPVPQPPVHEVLGYWYIPLMLVLGSLTIMATMYLIRATLRLSKAAQMRLG